MESCVVKNKPVSNGSFLFFLLKDSKDLVELIYFNRVEARHELFNFQFCFEISFVISSSLFAITLASTVLTHHNNRCSVCGLCREEKVEQNEWKWIPVLQKSYDVEYHPNKDNDA